MAQRRLELQGYGPPVTRRLISSLFLVLQACFVQACSTPFIVSTQGLLFRGYRLLVSSGTPEIWAARSRFTNNSWGNFLISAAAVSALPFTGVLASTAMIIWAAFGLVGMIGGLITVRVARHRSQPTVSDESPDQTVEPLDAASAAMTEEDQTQTSSKGSGLLLNS